jgi:hypothetical protein
MGRGDREEEELIPLGVSSPEPEPPGANPLRKGLAIGALVAVLVGLGALAGSRESGAPAAAPEPPAGGLTSTTTSAGGGDEPAPSGWRRGAPGPLLHRDRAAQVWTGTELVIWGGDPDGDSGAAYDPVADRWRRIAPAPIPARCGATTAWTGREMLVWGQACQLSPGPSPGRSRYATTGAAYEPGTDRWRVLPDGPVEAGSILTSVWTGPKVGGPVDDGQWILLQPTSPTVSFAPVRKQWRTLPPVPRPYAALVAQWTGTEVVVLGTEILEKGPSTVGAAYRHWTAALDPASGRWRELPQPPLELGTTAVWDGKRLIAWDQNLNAVALDPTPGHSWENLPALPFDFADCSPEGTQVGQFIFAEHCGQGAVWDTINDDTWKRIPHPKSLAELPVWTGTDLLFWVGRFAGSMDGVWLYRLCIPGLNPC